MAKHAFSSRYKLNLVIEVRENGRYPEKANGKSNFHRRIMANGTWFTGHIKELHRGGMSVEFAAE